VVLVDFHGRFKHVFVSLPHISTHKEGVLAKGYIACEDVEGGDF